MARPFWMLLSNPFQSALSECAQLLTQAQDPWWIIGSCAVALHGVDPGPLNDIDLLVSPRDAETLLQHLNLTNLAGDDNPRFRSDTLLRHTTNGIEVEFMAGLRVQHDGKWHLIKPKTRCEIQLEKHPLFAPSRKELSAILFLFGRQKDLHRRAKLQSTSGGPT